MNTFGEVAIWLVIVVTGLLALMGAALLVHLFLFDRADEAHDRRVLRRMVEPTAAERTVPFDQFWDDVMRPYEDDIFRKDVR